jgi:HK97 gp10 family phage protein
MAITMKTDGLSELGEMLAQLGEKAQGVASMGLYDGAGVMADSIKNSAQNIHTAPFHYAVFITRQPSPEEKEAVSQANMGISKFQKNGTEVNTSVGYQNTGYAEVAGELKPIPQIANAINSGTSFMQKQPFFRQAVNQGKIKASEAIIAKCEEEFNRLINS